MNTEEYLKLAEVEDSMWYFRSLYRHVQREFSNALPPGPAAVLDAGCGTGGLILRLAAWQPSWKLSGIDFSKLACELARQRCKEGIEIRDASVLELPFSNSSFDAVVSTDVLCQVENPDIAIREFFRILKPGGVLVINVPAYKWMWSYHDDACQSKHRFTTGEIKALLARHGGKLRRLTYWNTLPFPLVMARRKLWRAPRSGSDVRLYPAPIEAAFEAAMIFEHTWLKAGGRLPFGTSVLAAASKV